MSEQALTPAGPIFDSHAHYTSTGFEPDRHEVLAALPAGGVVGVCDCATHSGDAPQSVALAEQYPTVWAAVGIHPQSLADEDAPTVTVYGGDWRAEMKDMAHWYSHPKVVAVGECGLDHHWPVPRDAQYEMFEAHIRLAMELNKPIIVHDREAHAETYELLKKYKPKGIVHCYSGSADDAVWLVKQGLYLGFGGACTFKNNKTAPKVIEATPLEAMLLETDCPYLAPVPLRGKRNDSRNLVYVARLIAQIKGVSEETVYQATLQNANRVFGL